MEVEAYFVSIGRRIGLFDANFFFLRKIHWISELEDIFCIFATYCATFKQCADSIKIKILSIIIRAPMPQCY